MLKTLGGVFCWIFVFSVVIIGVSCSTQNENKIRFEIPALQISYYGMQGSPSGMTTTYKTIGCDPSRVVNALNKVGIRANHTTRCEGSGCIEVEGDPPFIELIIQDRLVTIIPSQRTDEYPDALLKKLAMEIQWAH